MNNTTDVPDLTLYTLSHRLIAYPGVAIVVLGITGNLICIVALAKVPHASSTILYLTNLAVADLTVCVVGQLCRVLPRALTGYDTASLHPWVCKSWFFINHSASSASLWTLVAVTVERTIVVYLPLHAKSICTRKYARYTIVILDLINSAQYLHYFWSYDAVYSKDQNSTLLVSSCSITTKHTGLSYYMRHIRIWQDFIVRFLVPFIFLALCNSMIIGKLIKRKGNPYLENNGDMDNMSSITVVLLFTSLAHLLFVSPLQILYLLDGKGPFAEEVDVANQHQYLYWAIAIDVYYLNHSINFVLYLVSGGAFRRHLWTLCGNVALKKFGKAQTVQVGSSTTLNTAL